MSFVRLKESGPIEITKNEGLSFTFDIPEAGENEGIFGAIGFQSLKGGEIAKDVRLNGFVVVSV